MAIEREPPKVGTAKTPNPVDSSPPPPQQRVGSSNSQRPGWLHQPQIGKPPESGKTNAPFSINNLPQFSQPQATASPPQILRPTARPRFGESSHLNDPLAKKSNVFNVPRDRRRAEHHRPPPVLAEPQTTSNAFKVPPITATDGSDDEAPYRFVQSQTQLLSESHSQPQFSNGKQSDPYSRDINSLRRATTEVVHPSYSTASFATLESRPPPTLYSARTGGPVPQKMSTMDIFDSIRNPGPAIGLERFVDHEPLTYVDPEKATENIKALLEGAFDDDDADDVNKNKSKQKASAAKAASKTGELADKLDMMKLEKGDREANKEEKTEVEESEIEDDGTLEGLKIKLLPHQREGVDWMIDKEIGKRKVKGRLPKGGILADDMGLGKTIQSISLILSNPRPPLSSQVEKDYKNTIPKDVGKGTLIVAPLALLRQWEAEITDRVESAYKLKVCVHHGPQRTKRFEDLKKYDVIITTYQILVSEKDSSSSREDGPQIGCFGAYWYRVILDEAHTIKNRNAKATKACYALRSEFRWCLTGTPMQNNLDELQSLICFLRIKPYDELAVWKEQISRPLANGRGGIAMRRLHFYLKAFMKRRTKDVLKQGGALTSGPTRPNSSVKQTGRFQITERKIEKIEVSFSESERQFYDALEARATTSLDRMMGGANVNYASALTLLLRLRQACNHPQLTGEAMANDKDALTTGSTSGSQSPRKKMVDQDADDLADLLGGLSVKVKHCDMCQADLLPEEAKSGMVRCTQCEADLQGQKSLAKRSQHKNQKKKHKKAKEMVQGPPKRTRPGRHRRVITDSDDEEGGGMGEWIVGKQDQDGEDLGRASGTDDEDAEGGGEWLNSGNSENDDDDEDDEPPRARSVRPRRPRNPKDTDDEDASVASAEGVEDTDSKDAHSSDGFESDSSLAKAHSAVTSTKIDRLIKILHKESPVHKTIVFSQFTSMLDLIEPFLKRERLVFVRYDGSMRNDQREASLDKLRNSKRTRVLLCSLRCGSLGLNLTAASRVVILEPFWNPFIEEQAIDRVHRINQTVDVVVYKLTVAKSVEQRILELQEKKRQLAQMAIESGGANAQATGKLSLKDILSLFHPSSEWDKEHDRGSASVETLPRDGGGGVSGGDGRGQSAFALAGNDREASRSILPAKGSGKARVDHPVYGRR